MYYTVMSGRMQDTKFGKQSWRQQKGEVEVAEKKREKSVDVLDRLFWTVQPPAGMVISLKVADRASYKDTVASTSRLGVLSAQMRIAPSRLWAVLHIPA